MKAPVIKLLLIFTLTAFFVPVHGQRCTGFDKRCASAPAQFEASSLSRSVSMRKGRKVVITQIFYGNSEYFISVCGKNRLGNIHFRLISVDNNNTVLYDNASDSFKDSQLFVINNTMNVRIELSAPHYFDDSNSECAGIKIFRSKKEI
jgi:hypothetical protein